MSTCKRREITILYTEWLILLCLCSFITVFSGNAKAITLAWDPSPDPTVTGYMVHHGTASGSYSTHVDAGMTNTHVVSNLTPGTNYYSVVTADIAAGSKARTRTRSASPSHLRPGSGIVAQRDNGTAPLAMNFSGHFHPVHLDLCLQIRQRNNERFGQSDKVDAAAGTSRSASLSQAGGAETLTKPGYITIWPAAVRWIRSPRLRLEP